MQRGQLRHVVCDDLQRKHNVTDITDRVAAIAVEKPLRRWPEHGYRSDVLGAAEIERRRHAGVAGIAPIGFPAGIEPNFEASP